MKNHAEENRGRTPRQKKMWFGSHVSNGNVHFLNHTEVIQKMDYVVLGKSNLLVSRTAFGAMSLKELPSQDDATALVKEAFDDGVNFFDTSKATPESERRLGIAIESLKIRKDVIIATKTAAHSAEEIAEDLDESLRNLRVDYIDLYQIEKPGLLPKRGGDDGVVEKLENLKKAGVIRHFGVTTESMDVAHSVLFSDVGWETLQYPFNMICTEDVVELVEEYAKADIGFIAMRPLCGGIIDNIPLALGFLRRFENVVPVWGARNSEELGQILYFTKNPPLVDEKFRKDVDERREFFN